MKPQINEMGKIYDFAWDCTVGAGNDADQPDSGDIRALERFLGHKLTNENLETLECAWARALMEMAQP